MAGALFAVAVVLALAVQAVWSACIAWRAPGEVVNRIPFVRSLPVGRDTRIALSRAMVPLAAVYFFILAIILLTFSLGGHSVHSPQGRVLQPFAFTAMGGMMASLLAIFAVVWFNRPKFLVPPSRRQEAGLMVSRKTGRDGT